MSNQTEERKGNIMMVSRTFEAPRGLVFEVFSDCSHLMNWYGGHEWPLVKCELDFREGGRWLYCMNIQDEELACGMAIYQEIIRPEKITYKDHFLDDRGEISRELPSSLITFEFKEDGGKTTVINRWEYPTEADLDSMLEMGAIEGLTEIWSRLNEYLKHVKTKEVNDDK